MTDFQQPTSGAKLMARVTCPHCWHEFPPEDILWVSKHADLLGDSLLGGDAQQRFLPTRFSPDGRAIDVKKMQCDQMACPRCHLIVSRAFLEMQPVFISILGAPGSGKSYFLASMTWELRKTLQSHFSLSFADADPTANQALSEYEERLFLNPREDQLVALPKTEEDGHLFESVKFGEREVFYPKPFVFSIRPAKGHPNYRHAEATARVLCMYDNAGENFLPGGDKENMPGTQHLALSKVMLFLFDPTQHPTIRRKCRGKSSDPQMGEHGWTHRQDQVLLEAGSRIRRHSHLQHDAKLKKPLIVAVTKYDAWHSLKNEMPLHRTWVIRKAGDNFSALDVARLKKVSDSVREVLLKYTPEIVSAAEGLSDNVVYVPVSALGTGPVIDEKTGFLGVKPADIKPAWIEMPILYALYQTTRGLVRSGQWEKKSNDRPKAAAKSARSDTSPPPRKTGEKPPPRHDDQERQVWKETGS